MELNVDRRRPNAAALLLYGYVVCLVALPTHVGINLGWAVVTPARVLLVAGLAAALMETVASRRVRTSIPGPWIVASWACFLVLAAASTFTGEAGGRVARLGSMALEGAGVFWLVWWVSRSKPVLSQAVMVGSTAVVAALSTGMAAMGSTYQATIFGVSSGSDVRFGLLRQEASFSAPLFYAVWLVAAGGLAIGLALSSTGRRRQLATLAWACLAIAVVTTASRFAMIAVPIVGAAALIGGGRAKLALSSLAAAALAAILFITGPGGAFDQGGVALPPATVTPVASPRGPTPVPAKPSLDPSPAPTPLSAADELEAQRLRGSALARFEAISATVAALRERPILGFGPLSAKPVVAQELGHPNFVDNAYLVILVEQGIAGLAAFLVLTASILRPALPARSPLSTSQIVAIASLLAFGLVAANLATTQGYALNWMTAALAAATADVEARSARLPT